MSTEAGAFDEAIAVYWGPKVSLEVAVRNLLQDVAEVCEEEGLDFQRLASDALGTRLAVAIA